MPTPPFATHLVVLIAPLAIAAAQLPSTEEVARRRLEAGRAFLREGRFQEALKDFRAIVDTHGDTSVADDALLEIARYYAAAGDLAQAEAAADLLLKRYPTSDSAPAAHVLTGRVTFERSRRPADVDAALASFDRVTRLFPDAPVVPEALFFAGEALRLRGRHDEAVARQLRVLTEYGESEWSARAGIGAAMALAASGDPLSAMELLQRARQRRSDAPEAAAALARSTVLFRLYVRGAGRAAFAYDPQGLEGLPPRLSNVVAMAFVPEGRLYYVTESGLGVAGRSAAKLPAAAKPRGLAVDRAGRVVVLDASTLRLSDGRAIPLAVPRQDGSARPLQKVVAAVQTVAGDWLIADVDERAVHRFARDGRYLGVFASIRASRLAIDERDDVAAIDDDSHAVALFDPEGRLVARMPPRGAGFVMPRPVDLAFDAFGHLYVLDREGVFVFDRGQRLVASYAPAETAPGAFRRAAAMAIDGSGRLFIFDERAQRILVHQ